VKRRLRAWDNFWFKPAPLADIAFFRMVTAGGQLFLYLFVWRPVGREFVAVSEIPHFYDPLAAVKLFLLPMGGAWLPTLVSVTVLYWITVGFLAFAAIGLFTNVSLAFAAAGGVFLQAYVYSFGDFHHPEAIMWITLAFLALSPCGKVLSIDSLRRRAAESVRRGRFTPVAALDQMSPFARWPIRLLVCLFALIYLSAAYYKYLAGGHAWMNGYTLQYYLLQDGLRWNTPLGVWLAGQHGIALISSVVTVLFEALFFLVVFFPALMMIAWPIGFAMHVGILVLMSAGFFEYLVLYLAMLPWTSFLRWVRMRRGGIPRGRLPVLFDGACPLCLRSVSVLFAFDWLGRLRFLPFQEDAGARQAAAIGANPEDLRRELHVIDREGKIRKGFFAFRAMAWHLPLLFPFAPLLYIPGMSIIGPMVYRLVADGRRRFSTCKTGAGRV